MSAPPGLKVSECPLTPFVGLCAGDHPLTRGWLSHTGARGGKWARPQWRLGAGVRVESRRHLWALAVERAGGPACPLCLDLALVIISGARRGLLQETDRHERHVLCLYQLEATLRAPDRLEARGPQRLRSTQHQTAPSSSPSPAGEAGRPSGSAATSTCVRRGLTTLPCHFGLTWAWAPSFHTSPLSELTV